MLLYLQLGDGEILSVTAQGTTTRPLPPDDRLIANQTTSLCQPEAWRDFRSAWVTERGAPLAGPALDRWLCQLLPLRRRFFEDRAGLPGDYSRARHLPPWPKNCLPSLTEATQQGSGDDITLAILQDDLGAAGPHQSAAAADDLRLEVCVD